MILLPKTFPVTRGIKQGRVLVPTLFAFYISALLLRAFPPTSGVLLHSQSRSSGKLFIYLVSEPALRLAGYLYVNCSMPTMRPLLSTVLQMHKRGKKRCGNREEPSREIVHARGKLSSSNTSKIK